LLAIAVGIARSELLFARTSDFTFEITGFDPRDLLRGHYLQFRLQLEPREIREACDPTAQECCLCVTATEPGQPASVADATCATARTHCAAWLDRSYLTQPLRYYVPEQRASELEQRLLQAIGRRSAQAVMVLDAHGQAQVRELRIDGQAIPGAISR
jgi:hypothetical protein